MTVYDKIDWKLLAEQKIQLFDLFEEISDSQKKHVLAGVITMIDDMQDEASKLGYPVYPEDQQIDNLMGLG